jgi:hypothetical protein
MATVCSIYELEQNMTVKNDEWNIDFDSSLLLCRYTYRTRCLYCDGFAVNTHVTVEEKCFVCGPRHPTVEEMCFLRGTCRVSSERMLHKDYYRKSSAEKIFGRGSQGA